MKTTTLVRNPRHRSAGHIRSFVNEVKTAYMLDGPAKFGAERRASERMNVTMSVRITPLDDDFQPIDIQNSAITRDISFNGVGLVTTSPVGRRYVLLTLEPCTGDPFDVIAKVAYCNGVGYYYRVGCEFLLSQHAHLQCQN